MNIYEYIFIYIKINRHSKKIEGEKLTTAAIYVWKCIKCCSLCCQETLSSEMYCIGGWNFWKHCILGIKTRC